MISEGLFHGGQQTSDFADSQSETSGLVPIGRRRINPTMTTLKERVEFLLQARGLTQAAATRAGGLKNTAFINDIVRGSKQSVKGQNLIKLATGLQTTVSYLIGETDNPELPGNSSEQSMKTHSQLPHVNDKRVISGNFVEDFAAPALDAGNFPRDVPVRGLVVCGQNGDFMFNGENVEWVRRPLGLSGKRDVYALRIEGESMLPAYKHGALVYVDPKRRPGVGEDAVVEMHQTDPHSPQPGTGYLKRVSSVSAARIILEQFNPPAQIEIDRTKVKSFHRVIPWEEVLGI